MSTSTLGDIAKWGSGGTPKRSVAAYFGEGVPWLSIADLNDDVVFEAKESLTALGLGNSSTKVVPPGTLLVAMYGSIGKLGIAGRQMCTSQAIAFAIPDEKLVDRRYMFHYLLAQRPALQARGRGGTQMNIGQADLKAWPIPLPPLNEQRRIAAILDQADFVRRKRREILAHLNILMRSIFHDTFESQDWPTVELSEVVREGTIVTYGIVQAGPEFEGGIPYIRTGDIVGSEIEVSGLRRTDPLIAARFQRSRVRTGDIVMSIRATVGTTAMVPPTIDGANLTQGTARIAPGESAAGAYLLGHLQSERAQRWINDQVKGATFREITLGRLRELPVPLPPLNLQQAFADRVEQVKAQRAVVQRDLAVYDELLASLQSRAFRGEV